MVGKITGIYSWMSVAQIKPVNQVFGHLAAYWVSLTSHQRVFDSFGPWESRCMRAVFFFFDGPVSLSAISTVPGLLRGRHLVITCWLNSSFNLLHVVVLGSSLQTSDAANISTDTPTTSMTPLLSRASLTHPALLSPYQASHQFLKTSFIGAAFCVCVLSPQ